MIARIKMGNATHLIDIVPSYNEGHILTVPEANVLNELKLAKLLTDLQRWRNKNPEATTAAIYRAAQDIQSTLRLDFKNEEEDLIESEALLISREKILAHLAAEGLPPPNNLELAASELAQHSDILIQARTRVEARLRAGAALLSGAI